VFGYCVTLQFYDRRHRDNDQEQNWEQFFE
jgi:hypothetical protein